MRKKFLLLLIMGCGARAAAPTQNKSPAALSVAHASGTTTKAVPIGSEALSQNNATFCDASLTDRPCDRIGQTDTAGALWVSSSPVGGAGYGAQDLESAYGVSPSGGAGVTVAVIEYDDDVTAEDDMAVYRQQNGLPACTSLNGCFRKVDENGTPVAPFDWNTTFPLNGPPVLMPNWIEQIPTSIALDMVSAGCPACQILLVEATDTGSTWFEDQQRALLSAGRLGAKVIATTNGWIESSDEIAILENRALKPLFDQGVSIFATSGNLGSGLYYPGTSQYVISVGSTFLLQDSSTARGWSETAFSTYPAGGGCSAYLPKPAWQTDTACPQRTTGDLSAVAWPGVAVYWPSIQESFDFDDNTIHFADLGSYWSVWGGVEVPAPLVAAIWASTGHAGDNASFIYANTSDFNDVTAGGTAICNDAYLCSGEPGYDSPTGWGSPNGAALAGP